MIAYVHFLIARSDPPGSLAHDHKINLIRNQIMIWSVAQRIDCLVDELDHEVRVYLDDQNDYTVFALTWPWERAAKFLMVQSESTAEQG